MSSADADTRSSPTTLRLMSLAALAALALSSCAVPETPPSSESGSDSSSSASAPAESADAETEDSDNDLVFFDEEDDQLDEARDFAALRPAGDYAHDVLPKLTQMVDTMVDGGGEELRMPLPTNRPFRMVPCEAPELPDTSNSSTPSPSAPSQDSDEAGMITADSSASGVPQDATRIVMDQVSVQPLGPLKVASAGDDLFGAVGYSEADKPESTAGYTTLTWTDEANGGEISSLTSEDSHTALSARSGCLPAEDLDAVEERVQELNDEFHERILDTKE